MKLRALIFQLLLEPRFEAGEAEAKRAKPQDWGNGTPVMDDHQETVQLALLGVHNGIRIPSGYVRIAIENGHSFR